jgi:predicted tellurium resistance membrane protein TerC
MEWMANPQAWVGLITLTVLEIVLGIDNIIFIAILAGRLPEHLRAKGRTIGLGLAMLTRIALLMSIAWITRLTGPLFTVFSEEISGRDMILLSGGLFLLVKSTLEIHASIEIKPEIEGHVPLKPQVSFIGVIVQIALVDIVFSLDSVITAVGLAQQLSVMIIAVMIAVIIMMSMSGAISAFIHAHPTLKILALSFLLLIGLALIGESFDMHIPKGYMYFAMAFSFGVEMLNMRIRRHPTKPL